MSGACQLLIHAIRDWYTQAHEGDFVVQLDFHNAFDSLHCDHMLAEVARRAPEWQGG